jgi:hypothetical protein
VSFAAKTLCVASQRVFIIVSVYFVMDSVRTLLDTPSYMAQKDNQAVGLCSLRGPLNPLDVTRSQVQTGIVIVANCHEPSILRTKQII